MVIVQQNTSIMYVEGWWLWSGDEASEACSSLPVECVIQIDQKEMMDLMHSLCGKQFSLLSHGCKMTADLDPSHISNRRKKRKAHEEELPIVLACDLSEQNIFRNTRGLSLWSLHFLPVPAWVLSGFLSQSREMHVRFIGSSKLWYRYQNQNDRPAVATQYYSFLVHKRQTTITHNCHMINK